MGGIISVMLPSAEPGLVIPWTEFDLRFYNTLMGVAAGAALLVVVDLGRRLRRAEKPITGYFAQ